MKAFVLRPRPDVTLFPSRLQVPVRRLVRTPVFTLAAIVTLSVAVAALTATFSVAHTLLVKPLPYPESHRLVDLGFRVPGFGFDELPFSDGMFLHTLENQRSFSGLTIYWAGDRFNVGTEDPERIPVARVTPGFFDVLSSPPALGRAFNPEDGAVGAEPVVVVSHALWERRWGADTALVGRVIRAQGAERRVVGIAREGFHFPDRATGLWLPMIIDRAELTPRGFGYPAIGRLAPDASLAEARADMERIAALASEAWPDEFTEAWTTNGRWGSYVQPFPEAVVGDVRTEVLLVLATTVLLLLLAFANVANLFLVRAGGRARELALREALGSGRLRLFGTLLDESLLVGVISAALGGALSVVLIRLATSLAPADLPRLDEIEVAPGSVALAALLCALGGAVFAGLAMMARRRASVADTLRSGGAGASERKGTRRFQDGLVALQVALAVTLLVGSVLLVESFRELTAVETGYDIEDVLTFEVGLPADEHGPDERVRLFRQLTRRLEEAGAVEAAGSVTFLPLSDDFRRGPLFVEGQETADADLGPVVDIKHVTPGYFEAMGIDLLEGRTLDEGDGVDGFPGVVVNRTLAEEHLGEGPALGRRVRVSDEGEFAEVVGVVEDVRSMSLRDPPEPRLYFPLGWWTPLTPTTPEAVGFAVRPSAGASSVGSGVLLAAVADAVADVDPTLPLGSIRTMADAVGETLARERFVAALLAVVALAGLLLAAVGVYGVIAYVAVRRRREVGIRMALGESARSILTGLVGKALRRIVLGAGLGLVAALGLSRLIEGVLFGVSPTQPSTYGVSLALVLLVGLAASLIPAWRASRLDPATVLRAE